MPSINPIKMSPGGSGRGKAGRIATWVAYVVLLVLSVPWYFPAGSGRPILLGFPLWCFVSLACYVLVAALTVWRMDALWTDDLPGEDPTSSEPSE